MNLIRVSLTRISVAPFFLSLLGIAMIGAIACGGSDDGAAGNDSSPTATVTVRDITPTATAVPRRTPTPTAVSTVEESGDELVAEGKVLFEKTAGGTGCAICHGLDAKGDTVIGAPDNRGADVSLIFDALGRVQNMSYITLTNDEAKAISAYLKFLATQP